MNRKYGIFTILQWRMIATVAVALLCAYLFAGPPPSPSAISAVIQQESSHPGGVDLLDRPFFQAVKNRLDHRIRRGLDLKGGIQLVLQVVTDDAIRLNTDEVIKSLTADFLKSKITVGEMLRTQIDTLTISGVDASADAEVRKIAGDTYREWDLSSSLTDGKNSYSLKLKSPDAARIRENAVEQAVNTIRNRIDKQGLTEASVQKQGDVGQYQLMVQFPGEDDPEKVKRLIKTTALLELKIVDGGSEGYPTEDAAKQHYNGTIPNSLDLLPAKGSRQGGAFYVVNRLAGVTGRDLKDSYPTRDQNGRPVIGFSMTPDGAKRFGKLTEENIGKGLAIILDGQVQSAPVVRSKITDSGEISGDYRQEEIQDMVLLLKSGALPAKIEYLQEQILGPSLGEDSIRHGVRAAVIALASVLAFVLFYYRGGGINASVAMILNLMILLGAMAWLGATMTLPGIAGVILTIGVGIDSNVLVFERIREELHGGKTPGAAISTAFKRVFVTLVDTHLAALISAVILYYASGNGPVRGFAVTLMIGLVSNMFTAVFVSRTLFEILLSRKDRVEAISI